MTTTSSSSNSWASARTAERAAERRETRALEARLAREAADAATQRRITEQEARRDRAQADRDRAEQRRTERATARAAARATRRAKALTWASSHVVELLIYPIALLSFALAAPAMAAYGHTLYGPPGVLLAGITELGMWAFALAVTTTRHQRPQRSVAGLQAGVVVFATVAAGLNLLHGLHQSWSTGVVMAVVSIAGVLAHQLTLAGAPRTRAERRAGRLAALAEAKTGHARRLALRDATAVIAPDGTATLAYRPGTYRVDRRTLSPTSSSGEDGGTDWDSALAALTQDRGACGDNSWTDSRADHDLGGGVAVLDPPADRPDQESKDESGGESSRESRPDLRQSTPTRSPSRGGARAGVDPGLEPISSGRSLDDLRRQLWTAVEHGRVDPGSAESIRRALRCSAARARHLRNEHRDEHRDEQTGGAR